VVLVFRLLLRLVRNAPAAFLGAFLFAVHPLQVESVAWIGETRGLLAAMFSLLALHRYCDFAGIDPDRGMFAERAYDPPQRRTRDFAWATIFFALALLSKPSATSLPLVVVVVDVALLRRPWRQTLRWIALWFAMSAGIMGLTKHYQRSELIWGPSVRAWYERPLVAGDAYAFYLSKLAWPTELAFDHGRTPLFAMQTPTIYYAWLLPVGVGLLLAIGSRRRIWLGCYAIFLVAIAPVSGIVTFLYQSISTVADRYMYVPLVGFGLLLAAWTATRRNPAWVFAVFGLLIGAAAHRAFDQTKHWRDDWAVYRQGLTVTPQSFMAHLHLGNRLRKEGQLDLAIEHYRKSLEIRPDYYTTHHLIGICRHEQKRYDEAIAEYQAVLERDPQYFDGLCWWGMTLVEQGKFDEALKLYDRAAEAEPERPEPHLLAGEALARRGDVKGSDAAFRRALAIDDEAADSHLRYGRVLAEAERFSEATGEFERAIALKPKLLAPRYELAATYFRQGKFVPAIESAEGALAVKPDDFGALQTLGLAQAAVGRTAAAVAPLEKALTLVAPASAEAAAVRKTLSELRSP
jgi:tetratricopeptide (TPR) repeat protein